MESERRHDMGQDREVVFKVNIVVHEEGDIVRVEPGEGEKVLVPPDTPLGEYPIEVTSINSLHVMVGSRDGRLMMCAHSGCRMF
jgi:hypothetical protein